MSLSLAWNAQETLQHLHLHVEFSDLLGGYQFTLLVWALQDFLFKNLVTEVFIMLSKLFVNWQESFGIFPSKWHESIELLVHFPHETILTRDLLKDLCRYGVKESHKYFDSALLLQVVKKILHQVLLLWCWPINLDALNAVLDHGRLSLSLILWCVRDILIVILEVIK